MMSLIDDVKKITAQERQIADLQRQLREAQEERHETVNKLTLARENGCKAWEAAVDIAKLSAHYYQSWKAICLQLSAEAHDLKAERDAAIERGAMLYRYASALECTLWSWVERAEAAEALLQEVAGAIQYDGKTLSIYNSLPGVLQRIPAEAQAKETSDD